jgi:hypothetical protein
MQNYFAFKHKLNQPSSWRIHQGGANARQRTDKERPISLSVVELDKADISQRLIELCLVTAALNAFPALQNSTFNVEP